MPNNVIRLLRSLHSSQRISIPSATSFFHQNQSRFPDPSQLESSNGDGEAAGSPHNNTSDDTAALRQEFGTEKRTLLHARGTVLRLRDLKKVDIGIEASQTELRKLELCRRYNLQPRDLGALEPDMPGRRAQIFVRPGTIVYSAHLRALIQADCILLIEKDGDVTAQIEDKSTDRISEYVPAASGNGKSATAKSLQTEMRKIMVRDKLTLTQQEPTLTPFEFVALEAMLSQTCRNLHSTTSALQTTFDRLLLRFSENEAIPTAALQDMLEIKDAAEELRSDTADFKTAVSDVLRDEADMAAMYLTDQAQSRHRRIGDDDELELLLETYRHHASSLDGQVTTLLSRLASINSHVTLLLSATRNRLLNLEITIAFGTMGISLAGVVGAFFGMNLRSGFEDDPNLFYYATASAIILALATLRLGRRALLKARSVKSDQYSILQRPLHHHHHIGHRNGLGGPQRLHGPHHD